MRILIVEDEVALAEPVKLYLEKQGLAVDHVTDGKEGLSQAQIYDYDCIILDLNLPSMDGLEVCEKLKEKGVLTPILMLTARSTQKDKITGLETGADDYLTKPFNLKELYLRVKALTRRGTPPTAAEITIGNISIDSNSREVLVDGKETELNNKEFGVLEYLAQNQGRVVSQEELLEHVWDEETNPFTDTVKTTIKTLRQKVDSDKKIIQTKRGAGYIVG